MAGEKKAGQEMIREEERHLKGTEGCLANLQCLEPGNLAHGMHRPACCVPDLLKGQDPLPGDADAGTRALPGEPRGEGVHFDSLCATVMAALQDENWDGRWRPSKQQKGILFDHIDTSKGAGRHLISVSELVAFAQNEKGYIDQQPGSLKGLLNPDVVLAAFKEFDVDGNGELDQNEWETFLQRLEEHRLKFLQRKCFIAAQAFWGRGGHPWREFIRDDAIDASEARQIARGLPGADFTRRLDGTDVGSGWQFGCDPDLHYEHPETGEKQRLGCCCFPPGWWADAVYYSANNHPLHGIFAADPNHRLDKLERFLMEVATIGFCFWSSELRYRWIDNQMAPIAALEDPRVFSVCVVTIPSMVMWWILFFLFTSPCGNYDRSTDTKDVVARARLITLIFGIIGWIFIALLAGMMFYKLYEHTRDFYHCQGDPLTECQELVKRHIDTLGLVMFGRLKSYLISWFLIGFVWLCPVVSLGSWSNPGYWGNYIGIGQWRTEKQRFKMKCHDLVVRSSGDYGAA